MCEEAHGSVARFNEQQQQQPNWSSCYAKMNQWCASRNACQYNVVLNADCSIKAYRWHVMPLHRTYHSPSVMLHVVHSTNLLQKLQQGLSIVLLLGPRAWTPQMSQLYNWMIIIFIGCTDDLIYVLLIKCFLS